MAIINFDARQVAPDEGRMGPVPAAWYVLVAKELKVEPTKDTTGTKMTAQFEIVEGQYKGRKVYHNFNIKNNSEKAQEIGLKQLSAFCHAVRVLVVQDTAQLQNIPFKAKLKVTAGDGQYDAKNEITAFKDISDPAAVDTTGASINLTPAPSAAVPFTPPPVGAAPAAAAPVAAPGGWTPPAAQQPWSQPGGAPNAAPAPASVAPAPASIAAPPPAELSAQPSWAGAPASAPAAAPAASEPPPVAAPEGQVTPPWM